MPTTTLDELTTAAIRDAMAVAAAGNFHDACRIAERGLEGGGDPATLNAALGALHTRLGEFDLAIHRLRIAHAARPHDVIIAFNLAAALCQQGEFSAALEIASRELAEGEGSLRIQRLRAFACQQLEDHGGAVQSYEQVVKAEPGDWESWNNLGNSRRAAGDFDGAIDALQQAAAIAPDAAPVRLNLANALFAAGRSQEAEQAYRSMAEDFPDDWRPLRELHALFRAQGREEEALEAIEEAARRNPDDMDLLVATASQRLLLLDNEGAEAAYREAVRREPPSAVANLGLAVVFELTNRTEDLARLVGEAEARGVEDEIVSFIRAFDHRRAKRFEEGLTTLSKVSDRLETARRAQLLGQLSEGARHFDEAWAAFEQMNEINLRDASRPEDRATAYRNLIGSRFEAMNKTWTGEWVDYQVSDPPAPAFLVGFPRSGTTLLDTFLMGHQGVAVLEEEPTLRGVDPVLPAFETLPKAGRDEAKASREAYFETVRRLADPSSGKLIVDKNPLLMNALPIIKRLFPDARIILALRHPCDVLTSCFATNFKLNDAMSNFLKLKTAAELYDLSFRFLERSQELLPLPMHIVRYEDLIEDQERELRGVVDFLGLKWENRLLDHQETARNRGRIKTASYAQVGQPIYRNSTGRWQNYREHLEPVLPILRPWIEKFGYTL